MRSFLFIPFILISIFSFCQKHEVSIASGFGTSTDNYDGIYGNYILLITPFSIESYIDEPHSMSLVLGCKYRYTPTIGKPLQFSSGLVYHAKTYDKLRHLFIPVGISGDFGDKFHVNFGAGLSAKFLLSQTSATDWYSIEYSKVQLAMYYHTGIGWRINDRIDLRLNYVVNQDITRSAVIDLTSAGGSPFQEYTRETEGSVQLELAYTLNRTK